MLLCCSKEIAAQGFLKVRGKQIVNAKGENVILRGMGLGGWMLQEGYMFKVSNLGQQYKIKEKISDVVGEEKTKLFYDQWLLNHTTKKDIDAMAAWGFNSIRLPMHYNLFTLPVEEEKVQGENTWLEKGFKLTDDLLKWCKQNKIYLILDLHATPGGQGADLPISDRDPAKPSLWESEANQQKMIALWKKLAARYAKEEWIGGYDIINEPNWGFEDHAKDARGLDEKKNEPLKKLMVDVTKAIREVDKDHIIIIEGNGFGNNYRNILPTWDDNMVLSFHKYGNYNTVAAIKSFLDLREKYNIPIWLGESGENSNTWFTEAIQLAESNNIGWAWWQEKKMGINNPLEIKQPTGYEKLLNYWSGKGEKPSAEEAWKILQELLKNIQIENNIFHPDVVDAMFRQVNSTATKPFKNYSLENSITIPAVDFDMGRQRSAYYDLDSASYQYTAGVNTRGNAGWTYRNDGVDIKNEKGVNYIFNIEDGEWLQYTIRC
jgi:endoglucanase